MLRFFPLAKEAAAMPNIAQMKKNSMGSPLSSEAQVRKLYHENTRFGCAEEEVG
jgi:hypothetical protein